jgi:hypothetical protein
LANWAITSPHNDVWNVRLDDCDEEHARSVLATLEQDTACPNDLELIDLTPIFEPKPLPEGSDFQLEPRPAPGVWSLPYPPEPEPPKKRRLFRRN